MSRHKRKRKGAFRKTHVAQQQSSTTGDGSQSSPSNAAQSQSQADQSNGD